MSRKTGANMSKVFVAALCATLAVGMALAVERSWTGGGDGKDWFDAANWSPADNFPQVGDSVTVAGTTALLLTNSTAALGALTITNATMTVSNWTTRINVGDFTLHDKGVVTLPAAFQNNAMSNRIHIVADNVAIENGGKIDVDGKGYMVANGPGSIGTTGNSNINGGGGYGGRGGDEGGGAGGPEYGVAAAPVAPGSGGSRYPKSAYPTASGAGGGAVCIEADTVLVDGIITANGTVGLPYDGGGSGGAVWITARAFGGNGEIRVNGGEGGQYYGGGGGGGGRMAVEYEEVIGAGLVSFTAQPGALFTELAAGMGTLYFSDPAIITAARLGRCYDNVRLLASGWHEAAYESFMLATNHLSIGEEGFALTVTNDFLVQGDAWLVLGAKALTSKQTAASGTALSGVSLSVGGDLTVRGATLALGGLGQNHLTALAVAGDVMVTNSGVVGGYFDLCAGPTNGAEVIDGGAAVITGQLKTATNSWLRLFSHPVNGGSMRVMCQDAILQAGGGIAADGGGFGSLKNIAYGPGAGVSSNSRGSGAGYGGVGGRGAENLSVRGGYAYGQRQRPLLAGSGGGFGHSPEPSYGHGGGRVLLEAGSIVIDGAITAKGRKCRSQYGGGGSGGGIMLFCDALAGSAIGGINADGGVGSTYGGGGGGGRIAVAIGLSALEREALKAGDELPELTVCDTHATYPGILSVAGAAGKEAGKSGSVAFLGMAANSYVLDVRGEPDNYGAPMPYGYGAVLGFVAGEVVTNRVVSPAHIADGVRGVLLGWRAEDGDDNLVARGDSTNAVFAMADHRVALTWEWTNEVRLLVQPMPNGTVNSNVVNGWYLHGTAAANITATPDVNCVFVGWLGDVDESQRTDNPLTLTMDQPRTIVAEFQSLAGVTRVWRGSGSWEDYTNWSPEGTPGPNDDVIVAAGSLAVSTAIGVGSLCISNGATVTVNGWMSPLAAQHEFRICAGATVTLPPPFSFSGGTSNRVWIKCGDFVIEPGGTINGVAKGYLTHTGPGKGAGTGSNYGAGGGHGGKGGNSSNAAGGAVYGVTNAPFWPGSGGGGTYDSAGGHGGGAVWIEATNSVRLDGTINVTGGAGAQYNGGGAGGSIFIMAESFSGGGSLIADGGDKGSLYSTLGGGGGGYIVVVEGLDASERESLISGAAVPGLVCGEHHANYSGGQSAVGGAGYNVGDEGIVMFMGLSGKSWGMVTVGIPYVYGEPLPYRYGTTIGFNLKT